MDPRFEEMIQAVGRYFAGLRHSDTVALAEVFHPQAIYACVSEGTLTRLSMEDYLPMVAVRPSPASRGEPPMDEIVSIEFAGPVTARATVKCAIGAKRFTDFLTFVKLDGRWRIIAKVFHFDLVEATA